MKCDEGRPVCTRCSSTGRVCDGYGVWGGGNNSYNTHSTFNVSHSDPIKQMMPPSAIRPKSQDEHGYLEWFRCRTVVKLRGSCGSPFWDTLVIQASLEQPSIFHAAQALSSAHKRFCSGAGGGGTPSSSETDAPDKLEQFTLRQYGEAINHLLHRRVTHNDGAKETVRVTLIACMLFICLEFLRGRYKTGNNHLRSGMRLLGGLQRHPERGRESHCVTIDDWLIEAFTRMNLLAVQFGQGLRGCWEPASPRLFNSRPLSTGIITFKSVAQARNSLDSLLGDIFHLTRRYHQNRLLKSSVDFVPAQGLLDGQQRIKSDLASWFNAYNASTVDFQLPLDAIPKLGYQLLILHFLMAKIMVDVCLRPDDEMAFDSSCHGFVSLIAQSVDFLEAVRVLHNSNHPLVFGSGPKLFLFNADIGWTPPLYYTALHCRIHRVRLRALHLLRALPSKEGIWDSRFAASVAEEVMRIEEGDFDEDLNEELPFDRQPHDEHLSLSTLVPASRRVYDVRVILPDSPSRGAVFTCKRKTNAGDCELVTRELDIGP